MSLKSSLLPGTAVAAFDADILAALKLRAAEPRAVHLERMQLGIRNEAGEIYRVVGISGMNKWLDAIEAMIDLGFVDELEDATDPKDGCDAIFSRPA